jgi:ParB/RepB/Spo0J family partition protein
MNTDMKHGNDGKNGSDDYNSMIDAHQARLARLAAEDWDDEESSDQCEVSSGGSDESAVISDQAVGLKRRTLVMLGVDDLFAHPENRDEDHGLEFQELCESVRELGVVQPIMVRWRVCPAEGEWYEILAGHRRTRAAREVGLREVPCLLLEDCSDDEALAILVVENFERLNLDAMQEAEALDAAMSQLGWTVEQCARKFSRSAEWVQLSLRLLDLPTEARKLVKAGRVRRETYVAALALADEAERLRAVQLCFWPGGSAEPLNGHQARQMINSEIVRPREEARRWDEAVDKQARKLAKEFKGTEFQVRVPGYGEAKRFVDEVRTWVKGREFVPASMLVASRSAVRWCDIAVVHGLPGYFLPVDGAGQADVYVNRALLIAGEEARHRNGLETLLAFGDRVERSEGQKVEGLNEEGTGDDGSDGSNGTNGSDVAVAPPDRRTVTRDSGRTVTVSRDVLERVRGKFAWLAENRHVIYSKREEVLLTLPPVLVEIFCEDGVVLVDWILAGCPEG